VRRIRELWLYREIILNLVRKELKVKYTASVLGAVWSLLNPVVFLAVFTFVAKVLTAPIEVYPVFLLAGLLGWNLFSVSLTAGSQSVLGNANIVKKVYFPREILPLATVGVALVDFFLQSVVFLAVIVVSGYLFVAEVVWLYPLAFVALLILSVAVTLWVSAVNVRYRDLQHLVALGLLVWFWMTPIVYAGGQVEQRLRDLTVAGVSLWHVYLLNPLVWVVFGFQKALYHSSDAQQVLPSFSAGELALALGVVIVAGVVLILLTWRVFFTMSGDFAEEL
jgi:ABC-2 type transport system permease protein